MPIVSSDELFGVSKPNAQKRVITSDELFGSGRKLTDIPESEFQQKNIALETAKGTLGVLGKSGGEAIKNITFPIRHPIQTVKGLGEAAAHPIKTIKSIGSHIGNRYGSVDKLADTVATDPFGFVGDVMGAASLTSGIGKLSKNKAIMDSTSLAETGKAVSGVTKATGNAIVKAVQPIKNTEFSQIAGRINNSLIGAKANRDLFYGNPGLGMAREKITGNSLEKIQNNIQNRLSELSSLLDDVYVNNVSKVNNYKTITDPIKQTYNKLLQNPKNNAPAITRLENIMSDLGMSTGKLRLNDLTPLEARALKHNLDEFIDWTLVGKSDKAINQGLKQAYHKVDSILDTSIPDAKVLNKRVTDMITAKKAIKFEIDKINAKDVMPASVIGLASTPLQVLRHPSVKTRLASAMVKKYEPINKQIVNTNFGNTGQVGKLYAEPSVTVRPTTNKPILGLPSPSSVSKKQYVQQRESLPIESLGTKPKLVENKPYQISGIPSKRVGVPIKEGQVPLRLPYEGEPIPPMRNPQGVAVSNNPIPISPYPNVLTSKALNALPIKSLERYIDRRYSENAPQVELDMLEELFQSKISKYKSIKAKK